MRRRRKSDAPFPKPEFLDLVLEIFITILSPGLFGSAEPTTIFQTLPRKVMRPLQVSNERAGRVSVPSG
jgi:hypothetical protein